ncbi:MAG TPA: enoyl-CoA hydratase-related protein [Deltaproteobacteria bacterium]|nr:enoyl-CoA hydratase-related protein [Deltaproteobacteria bacterium]HPJ92676.1 enoyl-CoA hydratase-related protein [Deltaproteobacteria bacterium]HPR55188.1 enoyl-CoA hydratase-related protein [Deltaproteobacteria bacterium]
MDYRCIEVQTDNHVAMVSLNRVDALNALSYELATEITDVFHALDADDNVWVVILRSNARIFSAGLDLKDAMSRGIIGNTKKLLDIPLSEKNLFECCHAIEECRKPVIAAVHGKCVGAGLDIISACDLRLCTEDAEFSLREARIGIVADMGVLQRLPYIIGQMYTRQMAYTGRFFSAPEVARMGLVVEVYPDRDAMMAAAAKLAGEIMESAPLAVQNTKDILNYSRFVSVKEGISLAVHKNMLLLPSEDCKESFIAFMEKRKPDFKGK